MTASGWNRKQFNNEMTKRLEEFRRGEWDVLVFPRVEGEGDKGGVGDIKISLMAIIGNSQML